VSAARVVRATRSETAKATDHEAEPAADPGSWPRMDGAEFAQALLDARAEGA